MHTIKKYGWTPDTPDPRDLCYKVTRLKPIRDVSLLPLMAAYDQLNIGSCTGNADGFLMHFLQLKINPDATTPSRLQIYYNARAIEHTIKSDAGAMIRDCIKSLAKLGVCSEKTWPYDVSKFAKKPSKIAYAEAAKNKAGVYRRLNNKSKQELVDCLQNGFPFAFGFTVFDSFESAEVEKTGIVPMPDIKKESMLGGHAVAAVGYDVKTDRFIVRNSWGTDWGQNGYFTIPAAYITDPNMADDFWTITELAK